jgi:hypothetical protein
MKEGYLVTALFNAGIFFATSLSISKRVFFVGVFRLFINSGWIRLHAPHQEAVTTTRTNPVALLNLGISLFVWIFTTLAFALAFAFTFLVFAFAIYYRIEKMSQSDINNSYTFWTMVFFVTAIVFVMLVSWTKNMGIVLGYIAVLSFALYVYKGTWKYLPQ